MELEDNVIVIPVLVSNDKYFQQDIIQVACDEVEEHENVVYKQDAILPDKNLEKWVIEVPNKTAE